MIIESSNRIDEVSEHYKPAEKISKINAWLFWLIVLFSLYLPYSAGLSFLLRNILHGFFIIFVISYFILAQVLKLSIIPKAEKTRRLQMLSDALGTSLSHERTSLYYNNEYTPSIQRLAANTMENALFSKEIAAKMLNKKRIVIGAYVLIWVFLFSLRYSDLNILVWITQVIFSTEILAQWLNLEKLRDRHQRVYNQLHSYFLHKIDNDSPEAVAEVVDLLVAYESAKSASGVLLSTKIFNNLNPDLSKRWERIKTDLNMN